MQKFFVGDVVKYVGKNRFWKKGEKHIISMADYEREGYFKYATDRGAWFDDEEFELIERAHPRSFAELDKSLAEEEEEY